MHDTLDLVQNDDCAEPTPYVLGGRHCLECRKNHTLCEWRHFNMENIDCFMCLRCEMYQLPCHVPGEGIVNFSERDKRELAAHDEK